MSDAKRPPGGVHATFPNTLPDGGPVNLPSTEAANLMLDSMEFQDDEEYQLTRATLAAIEEAARAEGRREAARELRNFYDAQMTNPNARWCSAEEIYAGLEEVAGLNASESDRRSATDE